jgi:NAD(P)-dependent dehydrogenase (short-subunit alcohol dehydrogenase family)
MLDLPDLTGQVFAVTGGNGGLGKATAKGLAAAGATVVLLCRSMAKATAARDEVQAHAPGADVHRVECDLSDYASVHRAAIELRSGWHRLDGLVHAAGAVVRERTETPEGHEALFAVNHLGPFLLTALVRDRLVAAPPARVVVLAGMYHKKATIDLDDPMFERRPWSFQEASNATQLARVMFALELAEQLRPHGVLVNAVHPGAVLTDAQDHLPWHLRLLVHTVMRPGFVRPDKGAEPVLRLAASPDVAGITGRYWHRLRADTPHPDALDPDRRAALWALSSELVGLEARAAC